MTTMESRSAPLWTRGMIAVLSAQFLSAMADNALLFGALALLKSEHYPDWAAPLLQEFFVGLDSGIKALTGNPELGIGRDYVRDEYRVLFVGSHAVYYTVTPTAIHVIRVLHGRMDPERHLQ
jgi:plasmid stabilization system protein ParE